MCPDEAYVYRLHGQENKILERENRRNAFLPVSAEEQEERLPAILERVQRVHQYGEPGVLTTALGHWVHHSAVKLTG